MTTRNNDEIATPVLLDERAALARTNGTLATPEQLAQRYQRFLAAATSDNTRRTYRSAIRHFQAWGGVLPCDEATVIHYLLTFAEALNPRTLSLRLTALGQWHRFQGFPDPTASATVRKTLRGIERVHGRPRQKAKALLLEDLDLIVTHLATLDGLAALRDSALIQVGYFGAFRRSELVMLEVHYLQWEREGLRITLPRSKTDQEGQGFPYPPFRAVLVLGKRLAGKVHSNQIAVKLAHTRRIQWHAGRRYALHRRVGEQFFDGIGRHMPFYDLTGGLDHAGMA